MKLSPSKLPLATLCLGTVLSLFSDAFAAEPDADLQKTFAVKPGGKLVLDVDRGSIRVSLGADDRVECRVSRRVRIGSAAKVLAAHEVTFTQEGNEVTIRARFDRAAAGLSFWRSANLQVAYEITVPVRFNTNLKTAGGRVSVHCLAGEMRLQTAGGNIEADKIDGTLWARTSGGDISAQGISGAIDVHTSGGNIRIDGAGASVRANTSGGSVRVRDVRGQVRLETSGGNIHAEGIAASIHASTSGGNVTVNLAGPPDGDCVLHTSGGNVHLNVPERLSANLDAHTSGGTVTCDLPITVQGTQKRHELKGRLGDGGPLLKLQTSGGNIRVAKS
jgi:hypothetical protein